MKKKKTTQLEKPSPLPPTTPKKVPPLQTTKGGEGGPRQNKNSLGRPRPEFNLFPFYSFILLHTPARPLVPHHGPHIFVDQKQQKNRKTLFTTEPIRKRIPPFFFLTPSHPSVPSHPVPSPSHPIPTTSHLLPTFPFNPIRPPSIPCYFHFIHSSRVALRWYLCERWGRGWGGKLLRRG